ncbi:MAG: hypothetical protein ACYDCH_04605 [Gaiellaceae bacterium]
MRGARLAAVVFAALVFGAEVADGSAASSPHLKGGQRVVFRAGMLRAGSAVTCMSDGIRVIARVPRRRHSTATIGDGRTGSATLSLATRADGSVLAHCG